MQKTLILVVTHRGISHETSEAIARTQCPSVVKVVGLANLAKARSIAFDRALEAVQGTPIDTILCIDDDMVFLPDEAENLVAASRISGHPTSGIAVNKEGQVTARPADVLVQVPGRQRWFTGLFFMAVPVAKLERVGTLVPRCGEIREWCQTGRHPAFPNEWLPEDFWFCNLFGGVDLAPIAVGHLKWMPLYPDERTVRALMEWKPR